MSFYQTNSELILSLAKLTSALLIAFAASPFLKRPALRATFWAGVLIILPLVIMATHGRGKLDILPQPSASVSPVEIQLPQPRASVSPSPLSLPPPSSLPNSEELPEPTQLASVAPSREINWVATVFLIGTAFSLVPILVSLLRIRLMSKKPAGESAMAVWEKIRPQTSPTVPLYITDSPSAPFTAGMIRTAVLLPEGSVTWSPRRLRSTLHHEAAHITRRDSLVRVLASFVRAILWFHPLVWLAHRQLVSAQEEACDEIALAAGIPPDEYAEDLLETAKRSRHAFGHSLQMARWSQLGNRIQNILNRNQTDAQPITMKTIATTILGITIATYGLSNLGFSETSGESKSPTDQKQPQTEEKADAVAKDSGDAEDSPKTDIEKKLRTIVIPRIDFEEVSIDEAIDFLRVRAAELDTEELDPAKKGINFVLNIPEGEPMPEIAALRLRNVPLSVALKYIADATKLQYKVGDFAVTFAPQTVADGDLFSRPFRVPLNFAAFLNASGDGEVDPLTGKTQDAPAALPPITDLLKKSGIAFLDGSSATLSSPGTLTVVNTPVELDKVEQLVKAAAGKQPMQEKASDNPATAFIEKKLRTILIPRIDFKETTIEEAADFLRQRARELDTKELDPMKKGINFVVRSPKDGTTPMPMIDELRLQNVPLETVLKYICNKTGMRYKVDEFAVTFYSPPTAEE